MLQTALRGSEQVSIHNYTMTEEASNINIVQDMVQAEGFDRVTMLGRWNDYVVWEPKFLGDAKRVTGYPLLILEDDEGKLIWTYESEYDVFDIYKKVTRCT